MGKQAKKSRAGVGKVGVPQRAAFQQPGGSRQWELLGE